MPILIHFSMRKPQDQKNLAPFRFVGNVPLGAIPEPYTNQKKSVVTRGGATEKEMSNSLLEEQIHFGKRLWVREVNHREFIIIIIASIHNNNA